MTDAPSIAPRLGVRSESFFVRPQRVPGAFAEALSNVEMSILRDGEQYEAGPVSNPQSIEVDVEKRDSFAPEVKLRIHKDRAQIGAEELGCGISDVSLIVLARCDRLKLDDVLVHKPLSEIHDQDLSLDPSEECEWFFDALGKARMHVEIYLILNREIHHGDEDKWEKGYWLAGHRFTLNSERDAWNFDPTPLDPETAEREGIPSSSLVYVTYQTEFSDVGAPLHHEVDPKNVLIIYVNASVLDQMAATTSEELRQMLSLLLQQEALQQLVSLIHQEAQEDDIPSFQSVEETGSLVLRVVKSLVSPGDVNMSSEDMYELIVNEPNRASAFCYAASNSSAQIQTLLTTG